MLYIYDKKKLGYLSPPCFDMSEIVTRDLDSLLSIVHNLVRDASRAVHINTEEGELVRTKGESRLRINVVFN